MLHADEDCRREAACRALLLSAHKEESHQQAAEKLIHDELNIICKIFNPLLSPEDSNRFRTDLGRLLHDGVKLWYHAQRSTVKIEASVKDNECWEWNVLGNLEEDPENESTAIVTSPGRNYWMIALFPRVFVVRDDDWSVVFPGVALWDSQTVAAEQELKECMMARRRAERGSTTGGLRRERRLSAALASPSMEQSSFLEQGISRAGRGNG